VFHCVTKNNNKKQWATSGGTYDALPDSLEAWKWKAPPQVHPLDATWRLDHRAFDAQNARAPKAQYFPQVGACAPLMPFLSFFLSDVMIIFTMSDISVTEGLQSSNTAYTPYPLIKFIYPVNTACAQYNEGRNMIVFWWYLGRQAWRLQRRLRTSNKDDISAERRMVLWRRSCRRRSRSASQSQTVNVSCP